jgi:2-haloacid dehalogenase
MAMPGERPEWLTFDCYGTLIQWDEGLLAAVKTILAKQPGSQVDAKTLIHTYDKYEHELERQRPHKSFRTVAGEGLRLAMMELGLCYTKSDIEILTSSISRMPPFREVVGALGELKEQGFRLCIISNTDDDIIAGNVAQLGGHVCRVITAQQAEAYKPSKQIFEHAYRSLGVGVEQVLHICASPHLDLTAARDIGFRCIWIDRGTGRRPLLDYTPNARFPTLDRVPPYLKSLGWA